MQESSRETHDANSCIVKGCCCETRVRVSSITGKRGSGVRAEVEGRSSDLR